MRRTPPPLPRWCLLFVRPHAAVRRHTPSANPRSVSPLDHPADPHSLIKADTRPAAAAAAAAALPVKARFAQAQTLPVGGHRTAPTFPPVRRLASCPSFHLILRKLEGETFTLTGGGSAYISFFEAGLRFFYAQPMNLKITFLFCCFSAVFFFFFCAQVLSSRRLHGAVFEINALVSRDLLFALARMTGSLQLWTLSTEWDIS